MKKEDLKLIQQYCELNDIQVVDIPASTQYNKASKHQSGFHHQKTKSEGATPIGTTNVKNHFHVKPQQTKANMQMSGKQQQLHNPVLDYQKFLEDEKVFQYHTQAQQSQKAKSSLGYYSQGHTPNNNTTRHIPASKSPDIGQQNFSSAHYNSQKHHHIPIVAQSQFTEKGSLISQSALSNYPNYHNVLAKSTNRALVSTSQNGLKSSSRKNHQMSAQESNYQLAQSIHPASINYNTNNPHQSIQSLIMSKNPSVTSYKKQNPLHNSSLFSKNEYSIEQNSQDALNDSSVYLYEEPLTKSNQQINFISKNKQTNQYQIPATPQIQDESYLDASIYEQFIQGPHNLSQLSNSKADEMNTYQQYLLMMQRPGSQNGTSINSHGKGQSQNVNRQKSPAQQIQQPRSVNASMIQNVANPQIVPKTKRTTNQTMQHSLNSSGQKQQHYEKRLLMGRTPSPNFLKKIAGLMQIPQESIVLQQHIYKNNYSNTNKHLMGQSGPSTKRSQSKQQFSSNEILPNSVQQLMAIQNNVQQMKQVKQKFAKQYGSAIQQHRYKSGAATTSANTAHNSPSQSRGTTPKRIQSKSKAGQQAQQIPFYAHQEIQQLADSIKSGKGISSQAVISHQQKLKQINQEEEKKALAMIASIKEYPFQKQSTSQSNQSVTPVQQFYQPMKMVGEIMEEDPQPLSSHEFINFEEVKSIQSDNRKGKKPMIVSKIDPTKPLSQPQTPLYYDGGTGSNGINHQSNLLLMSKNSALSSDTYTYSQNPTNIVPGNDPQYITQYLEQLNNLKMKQQAIQVEQPGKKMGSLSGQQQIAKQYQSNHNPVRQKADTLIKLVDNLDNDTPKTIVHSKKNQMVGIQQQVDNQSDIARAMMSNSRKKTQSVEPPKINTGGVDLFKKSMGEIDDRLKEHTNFQKKNHPINFQEKTPFEKELEQKFQEIKQKKSGQAQMPANTEQNKFQKYKEDSISILKQLQESGPVAESIFGHTDKNNKSLVKSNENEKNVSKNIPKKQIKELQGKKQMGDNSISNSESDNSKQKSLLQQQKEAFKKQIKDELNGKKKRVQQKDDEDDENKVLITQEDEQQIREVVADINERAFYGKQLRKAPPKIKVIDPDLSGLSPRAREIAQVSKLIKESFSEKGEPPVTTTDFYRIGKMLGRGAFGKVNLAMHKLVRRLVAIKSLNKECLTDEAQKAKLMKEVSLLLKFRHNHVVKIYETIETEKHIIICMELCAGGDLLNYVRKRRRLKEPYAKLIFKQIIDGLCYIHSKYIAHRDIKLDNILLDGKGNVKIADFGVSKQCQKGQRMTEQCGTPAYIAPEILKDKGYTFSVDLWSAGVVLFAMLYGTVPFKANNMDELHKLIVKGKYTLKDDISIEARNLLRGLLEVNPDKRLTIKQIYRHKWLADIDPDLQLFNDLERDMIRKEYTYNDPRRYNRNENEEPVDCFTEHHLESVYNSLQNVTSKSIILAPFNSTQSQVDVSLIETIQKNLCEKMMVLKFARRCREIDRQYEFNNNGELDNGVYHKFVYNSEEGADDGDGNQDDQEANNKELLSVPMLLSERKPARGGRSSVENSFENESNIKAMKDRETITKGIMERSALAKEMRNNKRVEEIDDEMVKTYETFQSKYSNKLEDDKIQKLISQGYPGEYVRKTLEENEPNYCTAGYYLLGMDQNYC